MIEKTKSKRKSGPKERDRQTEKEREKIYMCGGGIFFLNGFPLNRFFFPFQPKSPKPKHESAVAVAKRLVLQSKNSEIAIIFLFNELTEC